jgi:hypothetical protein
MMVSKTIAERYVGSNPTGGTNVSYSSGTMRLCTTFDSEPKPASVWRAVSRRMKWLRP